MAYNKNSGLNLTDSPILVIDNILKYLNASELKTLRSVCKISKSWVDRPNYLKNFNLVIDSEEQTRSLVASWAGSCPWSNVRIVRDVVAASTPSLLQFLNNSPHLDTLQIENTNLNDLIKILKNFSPTLTSLAFSIDSNCLDIESEAAQLSRYLLSDKDFKKNLFNLKELQIHDSFVSLYKRWPIETNPWPSKKQLQILIGMLFKICPNLTLVGLPHINDDYYFWQYAKDLPEPPQAQQFEPFIEYLNNRLLTMTMPTNKNNQEAVIRIDFGKLCTTKDFRFQPYRFAGMNIEFGAELNQTIFPITSADLLDLATRFANKIKLLNFPSHSLPSVGDELSERDKQNLDNCIESVIWIIRDLNSPPGQKYIPQNAKLIVAFYTNRIQSPDLEPLPANLKIDAIHYCSYKPTYGGLVEFDLFNSPNAVRSWTTELNICPGSYIYAGPNFRFSTVFPNLAKLYVSEQTQGSAKYCSKVKHFQSNWFCTTDERGGAGGVLCGLEKLRDLHLNHCLINATRAQVELNELKKKFSRLQTSKFTDCVFTLDEHFDQRIFRQVQECIQRVIEQHIVN